MSEDSTHTNRLASSASPYLLLHQHNPVDWYPWSEEALTRARAEDKPIFLSVGYSTCYWCHVMERESFSNEAIAELMNREFVNIKLDREERPDLDEIYMTATQVLTGHGGWPNSVFLTPDLEPFFAGTYFPPADRPGMPGFPTVLSSLAEAWRTRRTDVSEQAASVTRALRAHLEMRPQGTGEPPGGEVARRSLTALERSFDPVWGGFGAAPKFPTPGNLLLLLELAEESARAAEMLDVTLDRMARGGIYDQLGGGFHRYATDREWKVPHFEKMLYDNGLLLEVYARHWERTRDPQSRRIVEETAEFLAREMTSEEGGFWSALDAETDGREGAYYAWSRQELEEVLGQEDLGFLAPIFGFDEAPFFEGEYVLYLPRRLEEQAERRQRSRAELLAEIRPLRQKLLAVRGKRRLPLTDDKILADWNGMAIAGLATAGRILETPSLVDQATAAARFVLGTMRSKNGRLLHAWRVGRGDIPAFLADYAFLVRALLALYRATGEPNWRDEAERLASEQAERLEDQAGGFFATAGGDDVLVRAKDLFDGAVPAANSIAVLNLLELASGVAADDPRRRGWLSTAARSLAAQAPAVEKAPEAARTMTVAAHRYHLLADSSPESISAEDGRRFVKPELDLGSADAQGWRPFTLTLEIAPGWHIYSAYENDSPPGWVRPTSLRGRGVELAKVAYPEARELGELLGRDAIRIYEGKVEIRGSLRPGPTDVGRFSLELGYQACDSGRCLAPVTVSLDIAS